MAPQAPPANTQSNSRNNSITNSSVNLNPSNNNNNNNTNGNGSYHSIVNGGDRLPPLQPLNPPGLGHRANPYNQTSTSQMSDNSKKILRWHLWWNKQNSELRIPLYTPPNKNVDPKVGSLQNITHRPGGGNVQLIDEKLEWPKQPRIDARNPNYKRGGMLFFIYFYLFRNLVVNFFKLKVVIGRF
jgi:hypothetical protein